MGNCLNDGLQRRRAFAAAFRYFDTIFTVDGNESNNYIIIKKYIQFEWDQSKSSENVRKHGISFDEAQSVFYDVCARVIHDPDHSFDEERFIILGMSNRLALVAVVHCYLPEDEIIRIISAQKATKSERKQYMELLK